MAWFVLSCMSLGSCQSCCLGWCAGRSGSSGCPPVTGRFGPSCLGAGSCILCCLLTLSHVGSCPRPAHLGMFSSLSGLAAFIGLALWAFCWFLRVSSFPSSARFLALLCSIHGPWIVPHIFVASFQCSWVTTFCCRLWPFGCWCVSGALRGLPCWQFFLCPCYVFLTFFLTYTFGHLSFGSGPFPVLRLPLGGSLIPGLRVRFFLGFFSAFLSCFCAWVPCRLPFRRSVIPSGSCWTSVLLGSTGFLCAVACFAVSLLLHVFMDSFWTPLGVSLLFLLSGFPFPCSHFVFWIGSRGLCFCPRNFVPCNASTSSSGLAARLVLLGSCLFVAFSPYSGRGVLPSGPGFVLVPLPF